MKTARARRNGQGGMTLIEVMIAILLLAVGVAGMIAIQVLAMRDEAIAREDNEASRITRDVLEQIQRMPFAQVASTAGLWDEPAWIDHAGYGDGEVPVQMQSATGAVLEQGLYQVIWNISNVPGQASLRTVDVQVSWEDAADRQQTYTVSTLKYNQ